MTLIQQIIVKCILDVLPPRSLLCGYSLFVAALTTLFQSPGDPSRINLTTERRATSKPLLNASLLASAVGPVVRLWTIPERAV